MQCFKISVVNEAENDVMTGSSVHSPEFWSNEEEFWLNEQRWESEVQSPEESLRPWYGNGSEPNGQDSSPKSLVYKKPNKCSLNPSQG